MNTLIRMKTLMDLKILLHVVTFSRFLYIPRLMEHSTSELDHPNTFSKYLFFNYLLIEVNLHKFEFCWMFCRFSSFFVFSYSIDSFSFLMLDVELLDSKICWIFCHFFPFLYFLFHLINNKVFLKTSISSGNQVRSDN